MAKCKGCIHERVCVIKALPDAFENTQWDIKPCDHFKPATDVVPKGEVEKFAEEIKLEFYREFDEIIPSIMADKIDDLVKKYTEEK